MLRLKRTTWIKGALVLSMTLGLAACQKPQVKPASEVLVGLAVYDQSDVFIDELTEVFANTLQRAGKKANVATSIAARDAADSARTQDAQVQDLLDAGCNVLCVNLVDRTNTTAIIASAKRHNVPVIFFNREPVQADLAQWRKLYYVGADAKASGDLQGRLAADVIKQHPEVDRNHDGMIQYVVLEGQLGHQDAVIRTEEAVSTLQKQGISMAKVGYSIANWQRAQAENRMSQLIAQHQNGVELVLANNDAMALGARDAYMKQNRTEASLPLFFGIDGTAEGLKAVAAGQLAGTVYNDKQGQAQAMVKIIMQLTQPTPGKQATPRQVYVPYQPVTKETVTHFQQLK